MSPNKADADEAKSNAQASIQGATFSEPIFGSRRSVMRETSFHMMLEWFIEFVQTNPVTQRPPSPLVPQPVLPIPQGSEQVRVSLQLTRFISMK